MADPNPSQPTSLPLRASSTSLIHLTIRNRKKMVFEDEVKAMTSLNEKGIFDILPQHENFISIIKEYITIHKKDGQKETINIGNGVLKVKNSQISCYVDLLVAPPKPPAGTPTPTPSVQNAAINNYKAPLQK